MILPALDWTCCSRPVMAKKCTQKRNVPEELMVCWLNLLLFWILIQARTASWMNYLGFEYSRLSLFFAVR